jgi:hypothetical protein
MIHFDKDGNVVGLIPGAAGPRHGCRQQGLRVPRAEHRRKYDTKTGSSSGNRHTPEPRRRDVPRDDAERTAGSAHGPVAGFLPPPPARLVAAAGRQRRSGGARAAARRSARRVSADHADDRRRIEEIRVDEPPTRIYVADNYLADA